MSLNATAWAARQYFRSSDEQLAAFVLAALADGTGAFSLLDARRAVERARMTPMRMSDALVGLYRAGAVDPSPEGPVIRLALDRDFDFRPKGEAAA